MSFVRPAVIIILTLLSITSCRNSLSRQESFFITHERLTRSVSAEDGNAYSPVTGELIALPPEFVKKANLGVHTAIKTSIAYQFDGSGKRSEFIVITGNLTGKIKKRGTVNKGDLIGRTIGNRALTLIVSENLDPFLVCSSPKTAEKFLGRWWFDAEFLFTDTRDNALSYFPADTATSALAAMLGGKSGNLFRIRLTLNEYPGEIPKNLSVELTAYGENRTGIEEPEAMQSITEKGIDFMLFWPADVRVFLKEEYRPGAPLWIFCTFVPSDIDRRKVFVFVREFLLEPVESLYTKRFSQTTLNSPQE
jgi:hypothetical protein